MTDNNDFSDEVSESAKAAQDVDKALGSPMALLLGPTFKLIGEHWGKKTDAFLNPKQIENLENKIAIAQERGPLLLGNDTKPRQIAALIEWTDAAHDVDGDQKPQLSQAWGKALRDITEQNYILLDSLAKLDEGDITILKEGGVLSKEQLENFTTIGLIEEVRPSSLVGSTFAVLSGMFIMTVLAAFGLGAMIIGMEVVLGWPDLGRTREPGWSLIAIPLIMVVTFGSLAGIATDLWREFVKRQRIAKITYIGHELISKLNVGVNPELLFYMRDNTKKKRWSQSI
ncbi:hypothetical protein [Litoreibacter halocynthiae]|uniref:hypothetical protein n=1 Tax=Litoreibacter halocynthiae TaxID=1242689 RepID=UPI002493365C|nr:hypothetical protein [Litoreibacter halocynthiae]